MKYIAILLFVMAFSGLGFAQNTTQINFTANMSTERMISAALQFESLRVRLVEMRITAMAYGDNFSAAGDTANAERFYKISSMVADAIYDVDAIKKKILDNLDGMDAAIGEIRQDISALRADIQEIIDMLHAPVVSEAKGYLSIATIKDSYSTGERVELTDPPALIAGSNIIMPKMSGIQKSPRIDRSKLITTEETLLGYGATRFKNSYGREWKIESNKITKVPTRIYGSGIDAGAVGKILRGTYYKKSRIQT